MSNRSDYQAADNTESASAGGNAFVSSICLPCMNFDGFSKKFRIFFLHSGADPIPLNDNVKYVLSWNTKFIVVFSKLILDYDSSVEALMDPNVALEVDFLISRVVYNVLDGVIFDFLAFHSDVTHS